MQKARMLQMLYFTGGWPFAKTICAFLASGDFQTFCELLFTLSSQRRKTENVCVLQTLPTWSSATVCYDIWCIFAPNKRISKFHRSGIWYSNFIMRNSNLTVLKCKIEKYRNQYKYVGKYLNVLFWKIIQWIIQTQPW